MSGFSRDSITGYYVGFKKSMGDIQTDSISELDIPKYVHEKLIEKREGRTKEIKNGYDGIISNIVWVYAKPHTFDAIIAECPEFEHGAQWETFIVFYI